MALIIMKTNGVAFLQMVVLVLLLGITTSMMGNYGGYAVSGTPGVSATSAARPAPGSTASTSTTAAYSITFESMSGLQPRVVTFPVKRRRYYTDPTDQHRRRAGRAQQGKNVQEELEIQAEVPMGGGVDGIELQLGLYDVIITVGGQDLRVELDTGSSDFVVVSDQCNDCQVNTAYTPGSSAERYPTPPLTISYFDGTGAQFDVYTDSAILAGIELPNVTLGAVTNETGIFEQGTVDGVLGLAYPRLSAIYRATGLLPVLDQLTAEGSVDDVFTMCFSADGDGGLLTLGGGSAPDMKYSPYYNSSGLYSVAVSAIRVGSKNLTLPHIEPTSELAPVIDTGTSGLIIGQPTFDQLQEMLCDTADDLGVPLCDENWSLRYGEGFKLDHEDLALFPTIEIPLDGGDATFIVPPANYFRETDNGYFVISLIDSVHYGGEALILGDVALLGHMITFDRINLRVGTVVTPECSIDILEVSSSADNSGAPGVASPNTNSTAADEGDHNSTMAETPPNATTGTNFPDSTDATESDTAASPSGPASTTLANETTLANSTSLLSKNSPSAMSPSPSVGQKNSGIITAPICVLSLFAAVLTTITAAVAC